MGGSHVQGHPQGTLSSVQGWVGPYVATVSSPCLTVPAGGSLRLDCLCSVARAERPRASRESGMLVPARQSVPRDQPRQEPWAPGLTSSRLTERRMCCHHATREDFHLLRVHRMSRPRSLARNSYHTLMSLCPLSVFLTRLQAAVGQSQCPAPHSDPRLQCVGAGVLWGGLLGSAVPKAPAASGLMRPSSAFVSEPLSKRRGGR